MARRDAGFLADPADEVGERAFLPGDGGDGDELRGRGQTDVPRSLFTTMLGDDAQLNHPRVRQRLDAWQRAGAVEFVGSDDCWLRVLRPLA